MGMYYRSEPLLISIGNNVTIEPMVYILAHDASTKRELGYTIIGKVDIRDNVFIGANSVVTNSISENSVAVGNLAKVIKSYNEFIS